MILTSRMSHFSFSILMFENFLIVDDFEILTLNLTTNFHFVLEKHSHKTGLSLCYSHHWRKPQKF